MGLLQALDIGRNSLSFNQTALQTVAHNIANAGVEGFSRQEVVPVNNPPINTNFGFLGTGVRIQSVRQFVDKFLNAEVIGIKSDLSALTARSEALQLTETFLNLNSEQGGLNGAYNQFFAAAEDLSARPEASAERTAFINAAQNLANEFNTVAKNVEELQVQANRDILSAVSEVNVLTERIANLNARIQTSETAGRTANDLRDERQRNLEQLGEIVSISSIEDGDGAITVIVGGGFPVVQKGNFTTIQGIENPDNVVGSSPPVALAQINFVDLGGVKTDITNRIAGGRIGGLLQFRDASLKQLLDNLNLLAATTASEVNLLHRQGFGLDGSSNNNLFNPIGISVNTPSTNSVDVSTKKANIQAVPSDSRIFDPTAITGADYKIEFTSSTTLTITALDTGVKLNATQVSISGGPFGTDSTKTDLSFSGSPVSVEFEGLRMAFQNFAGVPQKGDSFTVSIRKSAARNMGVNQLVASDINKVAAAGVPGVAGDNATALAIADLRTKAVAQRDSSSLTGFLDSTVSTFATETRDVRSREDITRQFSDTLQEAREGVSGVSLDEEMANIIRFQQNFGATARLMSITTDLLEEILNII